MIVTRREFLAIAGAAPAWAGQTAVPSARQPQAQPPAQPMGTRDALKLGDDRDGFVYLPKGYVAGTAMPLLFMLHGAGSTALSVQYSLPLADEFGVIILAPDSRDERTWDGVLRHWGPDVEFMAAALDQTVSRYSVNTAHLGVG